MPRIDARGIALLLVLCAAWSVPRAREASECSGGPAARLPADTSRTLALDLNLPAFRLVVREHDTVSFVVPVATGRTKYPTPIGYFGIDYVVWNPRWTPPPSPWARGEKPQAPGPGNWMGRVKLHFTGLVFLHGSPFVNSFGTSASHACVRMSNANAVRLARVVHRHASPDVADALLDTLVASHTRTQRIALTSVVPITVRYDLAEVRDGRLEVYPDIYPALHASQRVHALAALAAHGVDSAAVDGARLDALLRSARRRMAAAPVDSLRYPVTSP